MAAPAFQIRLTADQYEFVRAKADEEFRSLNSVIRELVSRARLTATAQAASKSQ